MAKDNLPIGTIMAYGGQTGTLTNSNWKICDGDKLLRSQYPILFSVLSNNWGPITGPADNQFFHLPDLRGLFIRGANTGRTDEYKDNEVALRQNTSGNPDEVGSKQFDAIKKHSHQLVPQNFGGQVTIPLGVSGNTSNADGDLDGSRVDTNYDKSSVPLVIDSTGADESRPKNAYVHYIIKVKDVR
jgi:microcystin-dependent protein